MTDITAFHSFAGSGATKANTRRTLVPYQSTLTGFVEAVSDSEGVSVRAMEPLTVLVVQTENSVYRIIVLRPAQSRIVVQGGRFFAGPSEGQLAGSSFGGSLLKMGWIGVGLHLEIYSHGQRIVTSRVRAIEIQQDASGRTLH